MSETNEAEKSVQSLNAATMVRFTADPGPTVPWGIVGAAFGWVPEYFEHGDYEGAVCLRLNRGRKLEFTPDGMLLHEEDGTMRSIYDDQSVLAILRFG